LAETRFYFACDRILYTAMERLLTPPFEVVCVRAGWFSGASIFRRATPPKEGRASSTVLNRR